jgi:cytochrome c oxidase cbb3-type subunit 3
MATRRDELLDHEYDGIREYDNPCPTWWHLILWGTVVFSAVYFVFFHIAPLTGTNGWSMVEAYDASVADNMKARFAEIGELQADEPTLVNCLRNPELLAVGKSVYQTHCKSCHAADGSGLVGPNLTDDYYKNVKQLLDIVTVIEDGAANGSMPAWRNRLIPNEVVLVSAYVAGLRGQNLPGPRGPEGAQIDPWPAAPANDAPPAEPAADRPGAER